MVFRIGLNGTEDLDLDGEGDGSDYILVLNSYGPRGNVATYGGNDVIVLNDFSTGFSGSRQRRHRQ